MVCVQTAKSTNNTPKAQGRIPFHCANSRTTNPFCLKVKNVRYTIRESQTRVKVLMAVCPRHLDSGGLALQDRPAMGLKRLLVVGARTVAAAIRPAPGWRRDLAMMD